MHITGTEQLSAWTAKIMPPVEEVRSGIWSIPVPIPNNPLRYVLAYALESAKGIVLVDAGWECEESWDVLVAGLGVVGASPKDVSTILVTHMHPDHYGLVQRLREVSDAAVAMHPADAALLAGPAGTVEQMLGNISEFLLDCGMPKENVFEQREINAGVIPFRDSPPPDMLLNDRDIFELGDSRLRVVWTPGHTPGHICFLDEERKLLLAGDHVLPRISPNISLYSMELLNPLSNYLASLAKVGELDVEEVLPAHEYRFSGLKDRASILTEHHMRRLEEIFQAVNENPGFNCYEIAETVTWSRGWDQVQGYMRQAALGETKAHLMYLAAQGKIYSGVGTPQVWFGFDR